MDDLLKFVRESLAANQSREEIARVLGEAGWREEEVEQALGRFANVSFPVPVPTKKPSISANDAFLYLVSFAALYTAAVGLGVLLFGLIDHWLPDSLTNGPNLDGEDSLRWATAALLVGFPMFFLMIRRHWKDYARDADRLNSPVRKWLTYITLTIVADVLIGTGVDLVANIIGGSIALATCLKIATIVAIAGSIFLYYNWELRWKQGGPK